MRCSGNVSQSDVLKGVHWGLEMAHLKFTSTGFPELQEYLDEMADRSIDAEPFMNGFVVPLMIRSAHGTFEVEGRPAPWKVLADSTVAKRRNEDSSTIKALRDTGMLWQSIGSEADGGISETGAAFAEIGTRVEYAAYHQDGTDRIPARPFLLFQDQDISDIAEGMADWIVDGAVYEK
jgi:phage gpG-like protein